MPAAQPDILPRLRTAPPGDRLVDTHAHLHFPAYAGKVDHVLMAATEAGVGTVLTVGVNTEDSRRAADLAAAYADVWAAVGIHPHDAGEAEQGMGYLRDLAGRRKVVAIGECGLDYFRSTTSPEEQETALRLQLGLAQEKGLPLIFHVRDAFDQFFKVLDDYPGLPGVVHSFTAGPAELEAVLERGWYVALNGIVTFAKPGPQLDAARSLPLDRLLLETDCPFLSPVPHRGKQNEPARVADIAAFLSDLRREPISALANATSRNAARLFKFSP